MEALRRPVRRVARLLAALAFLAAAAPAAAAAQGLDAEESRAALAFFVEEIASKAPDFADATPALKLEGYSLEERVFVHPSDWIRVSFVRDESVLMTYVLEEWSGEMTVFEDLLEAAFGAPPTVVEEGRSPAVWQSAVNGETVTFMMLPTEKGGYRQIALVALIEGEDDGA